MSRTEGQPFRDRDAVSLTKRTMLTAVILEPSFHETEPLGLILSREQTCFPLAIVHAQAPGLLSLWPVFKDHLSKKKFFFLNQPKKSRNIHNRVFFVSVLLY